jgi:hypothetical protein
MLDTQISSLDRFRWFACGQSVHVDKSLLDVFILRPIKDTATMQSSSEVNDAKGSQFFEGGIWE